jgi:Spy/CpxP family protein refolding chaperone
MNWRKVRMACAVVLCTALTTPVQAQSSNQQMGGMMPGDAGSMGMMGGPMMDMMMGQGMGMMGGPGMMSCPMMGGGPMMGRGPMMGAGIGDFLRIPDLSDEQRQQLIERDRQLQRELLKLEGKSMEARFALQDAARTNTPDPKAVGHALENVFAVRTQMVEATIAAANDGRAVLTEQQREALDNRGRVCAAR